MKSANRAETSDSSVSAADPLLDRALPVSPFGGGMASISSEYRPISPYMMLRAIRELLVLFVLNSSVINCCFWTWTVMIFSVLVTAALAKQTVVDTRQPAMAILLSIPIVVSRTESMVRFRYVMPHSEGLTRWL